MSQSPLVPLGDSIEERVGLLYRRRAASLELMRVLEEYERFSQCAMSSSTRAARARFLAPAAERRTAGCAPVPLLTAFRHELKRLYLHRATINELIRSIENYHRCQPTPGRRLRPLCQGRNRGSASLPRRA